MAVVKWSDHAMTCLRQQARYIAEQSQSAAIAWNWMTDILDEAERLADFPRAGHPLSEFPNTPYLEILARKFFRIIYRINGKSCFIITVRRTSMLLDESVLKEMNAVT